MQSVNTRVKSPFKCNGVRGLPGALLSAAEIERIGPHFDELLAQGSIELIAQAPAAPAVDCQPEQAREPQSVPSPEPSDAPAPEAAEKSSDAVLRPDSPAPARGPAGKKKKK